MHEYSRTSTVEPVNNSHPENWGIDSFVVGGHFLWAKFAVSDVSILPVYYRTVIFKIDCSCPCSCKRFFSIQLVRTRLSLVMTFWVSFLLTFPLANSSLPRRTTICSFVKVWLLVLIPSDVKSFFTDITLTSAILLAFK